MDPALLSMAGGVLQGLFGGGGTSEVPQGMKWILPMLKRNARFFENYAKGVPGSDPGEAASLASARALLGQQFANQREGLLAAVGTSQDPGMRADLLGNVSDSENTQMAALMAALLNQFRADRKNARLAAVDIARGAGSAVPFQQTSGGSNIGSLLGTLAQNVAYTQALKPRGGGYGGVQFGTKDLHDAPPGFEQRYQYNV